jgi:hypothetical protein
LISFLYSPFETLEIHRKGKLSYVLQAVFLFSGSFGRLQGTARYFWPSKITNPQSIWSPRAAAISSYMVRNHYKALFYFKILVVGVI